MYSIIFGKGSFHNIINLKDATIILRICGKWRDLKFVFCFLWISCLKQDVVQWIDCFMYFVYINISLFEIIYPVS